MIKSSRLTWLTLIFCLTALQLFASENYLTVKVNSDINIEQLSQIVSIDNIKDGYIYIYANDRQLNNLKNEKYDYEILPHPGTLIKPKMSSSAKDAKDWDSYPTYEAYIDMMNQFAIDYPSLCTIVNIGSSVEGRALLYAKISDNVNTEEDEPEVMYTATMHGDETTGYVLMLRLIDSLLVAYGSDSLITRLVDSCEIWINPLANPDGTYNGGNSSVYSATRYNANGVDLNRNFPDPQDGQHPDGNSWQPETVAMMDFAPDHNFAIAANIHGGAEVLNYPWDTWAQLHADDAWYIDVCRHYADTAQYYSPSGYMTDLNNGITNGYAWYSINGGRQDYMNYWHASREITHEMSGVKLLPASQLPAYWGYNRIAFLDWLENGLYGIRGLVSDSVTGVPIYAKVTAVGHDFDNSEIYTDPDVGDYHRTIEAGTFTLQFSADGYADKTISSISVSDFNTTIVNVVMQSLAIDPVLVYESHNGGEFGPGDTVQLNITLENSGGGIAYYVNGYLETSDADITITQSTSDFPQVMPGGSSESNSEYKFIVSPSATDMRYIDFTLYVTADGGYDNTLNISFYLGERSQLFSDDFSLDQGWSGLGGPGEWTLGPAAGGTGSDGYGGADPSLDHTLTGDNYILGNDLNGGSGGDYNSYLGMTYWVTSPMFDCTNLTGIQLTFYRWLGVEGNADDHAYLQAYNGTSWETVYENGSSTISETSWNLQTYDLSTYGDNNPDFQIRFGIGSTDGTANYCGWNIDDLELRAFGEIPSGAPMMTYQPTDIDDSLHMGQSVVDSIKVYNNGEALLRVRFYSEESWISLDENQHNVAVDDSLILPVTLNSGELTPGQYYGSIEYTSNDTIYTSGSIPVGMHIYAPDIFIAQGSVDDTLATDGTSTKPLIISNNGPGQLQYEISRQMFSGKESVPASQAPAEPLGWRLSDDEKDSPIQEPYFAAGTRGNGGPDDWGYSWIDSDDPLGPEFGWVDISVVGTEVVGLGDDDTTGAISIGFDFPYYENSYSQLYISSNGIITFGSPSTSRTNYGIPTAAAPNNLISMWWDDLDPRRGGHIYYYYDSDSSRFIVSFVEIRNYYSTTGTGLLTFQAILHSSGKILLHYGHMDPGSDASGLEGATVGIENGIGDDGLEVIYNAAYMHDTLAVLINAANWLLVDPAIGTVEPFSDDTIDVNFDATELGDGVYSGQLTINSNDQDSPVLTIPVSLTIINQAPPDAPTPVSPADGADSLSQPITLDWSDVTGAIMYQLQVDTSSGFVTPLFDTSLSLSQYDISGLEDGAEYFWRVRAENAIGWGDWSSTRSFTTIIPWVCGDANGDDEVNIFDVTFLISYLYKGGPPPVHPEAADVNGDTLVNIFDATYLITFLYKSGPPPDCL